jgi:hypothetical protein
MPLFVELSGDKGYPKILKGNSKAVIDGYGTFLANRYKNFPRLIWLTAGCLDV